MTIYVNDVVRPLDAKAARFDGLHRVIHIDGDFVALMGLARPWRMWVSDSLKRLSELEDGKKLDIVTYEGHSYTRRRDEELPASAKKVRDEAMARITPLVEGERSWELFDEEMRGRAIAKRAGDLGVTVKTLHRVLFRYWAYGQTEAAVTPDWSVRGGKGKRRSGKKRGDKKAARIGRPPSAATISAGGVVRDFNAGEEDCALFKTAMDLWFDECGGSLRGVWRKYTEQLCVQSYEEKDGVVVPIPRPAEQIASFDMFEHAIQRDMDAHELEKRRLGERLYLQTKRGLNGSGRESATGPGDQFQIDATLYDIYLVNRLHRSWIIGRPVVYLVMDQFSTMITGLFVGLWGPSWDCARLALMNAFTDKVEFCRRYGIDITYDDWPCTLLPSTLFADRQELLTDAAEGLRKNLKIHCEVAQGYRPDLKFIESRFRILNLTSQVHWLPGAVSQRAKERNGRDYRLDAVLDLYQFTRILIRAVLHYNNFHFCPQHLLTHPALASAAIDPTPISLLRWGASKGMGSLRRESDVNHLRFSLLPTESVRLTDRGILFRGMHYETDRALKEDWFSRVRGKSRVPLEAAFDRNWTNEIWLRDPATGRFDTARLREFDKLYVGHRLEEADDLISMNGVIPSRLVSAEMKSHAALDALISDEVVRGEQLAAQGPVPPSKAARVAGIRENRAEAGSEQQAAIAAQNYGEPAPKRATSLESDDEEEAQAAAVIDLMRHRRERGART